MEDAFRAAANGEDTLLVLSGGLDSAYILWKYSQIVKDRPIFTHHINLYSSWSTRLEVEEYAVRSQIQHLNREVAIRRSSVNTEGQGALIRDLTLGCLLSAEVAMFYGCRYIMVGDDLPSSVRRAEPDSSMNPYKQRMNISMGEYVRAVTKDSVDVIMGMESNSVADAYNEMPDDYLALVSSCREPLVKSGVVSQCGDCHSCKKNKDFGFFDRLSKSLVIPMTSNTPITTINN